MAKELTHRANELKELGWGQEDLNRYIELWDYRQRWGAINLEREDRQFLRKAESLLPEITKTKASIKKPLKEKSYYRWLRFFLDEMNSAENKDERVKGKRGVWAIILEEELRALDYYQPVLGLPDTIKAKLLTPLREELIDSASKQIDFVKNSIPFDFEKTLLKAKDIEGNSSWKSLRNEDNHEDTSYPLIENEASDDFRKSARDKILTFISENFPSIAGMEKSAPPDDWN